MFFLIPTLIVICFSLPVITASRMIPVLLLSHDYNSFEVASILAAKLTGNFLGLLYFRRIFFEIGSFRLLTTAVVIIIHCFIFLFNFINIKVYFFIFFIFGFFELCIFFLIKPLIRNLKFNFVAQFEMLIDNVMRFLSGLLIIIKYQNLFLILIGVISFSLIPYVLTEKNIKNLKDDKKKIYLLDSKLSFVILNYFPYFISSLIFYTSSFLSSSYLIIFLTKIKINQAPTYLTIYLLGQLFFSYFFNRFVQSFPIHYSPLIIHGSILFFSSIIVVVLLFFHNINFFNLNIPLAFTLFLYASVFSTSLKSYFKNINTHSISEDMTDGQIKLIGGFFGVVIGTFSLIFNNRASLFIIILLLNSVVFLYKIFEKLYKKLILQLKD